VQAAAPGLKGHPHLIWQLLGVTVREDQTLRAATDALLAAVGVIQEHPATAVAAEKHMPLNYKLQLVEDLMDNDYPLLERVVYCVGRPVATLVWQAMRNGEAPMATKRFGFLALCRGALKRNAEHDETALLCDIIARGRSQAMHLCQTLIDWQGGPADVECLMTLADLAPLLTNLVEYAEGQSRQAVGVSASRVVEKDFVRVFAGEETLYATTTLALAPTPSAQADSVRAAALHLLSALTRVPCVAVAVAENLTGVDSTNKYHLSSTVSNVGKILHLGCTPSAAVEGGAEGTWDEFAGALLHLKRHGRPEMLSNVYHAVMEEGSDIFGGRANVALGGGGGPVPAVIEEARLLFVKHGQAQELMEKNFTGREMRLPTRVVLQLAVALHMTGADPYTICRRLAELLRVKLLEIQNVQPPSDEKPAEAQRRRLRIGRFDKAITSLTNPAPKLLSDINEQRETARAMVAAVAASSGVGASSSFGGGAGSSALALLPPSQPPAPCVSAALAAPMALAAPPPQPTIGNVLFAQLDARLKEHQGCARCAVARDDEGARLAYTEEGGTGRTRNIGAIRCCPLFEHGITKRRLAEMVGGPGSHTAKRRRVDQYMTSRFGVTPLGKPTGEKPYDVAVYKMDEDGRYIAVGMDGQSASLERKFPRVREFYQGFVLE